MKKQQGFTLIELMIVVAIIAILAAIALPAYQNYVARSQVTSGLADIRGGVTAFEEIIQRGSQGTAKNTDIGLAASTTRCKTIDVTGDYKNPSGQQISCDILGNPKVQTKKIKLVRDGSGAWNCKSDVDDAFKPKGCTTG